MTRSIFASVAFLSAFAAAQTVPGTPLAFPLASNGGIDSTGEIGEVMITSTDADGDEVQQIWLYAKWRTGASSNLGWKDGFFVQNYLQLADSAEEGKYLSMSCNAVYSTSGNAASVAVHNFYGDSIAATAGESKSWDAVGDAAGVTHQWFEQDAGIAPGGGYSSTY